MKRDSVVGPSSSATVGVEVIGVWDSHLGWTEFRPYNLKEAGEHTGFAMPILPHTSYRGVKISSLY